MLLGQERPVVTQLLKEHPYGLFIFSNQAQDHWHFINVKYDAETEKRRLFRRISISPEERLRTASERVTMLDLQSIQPDMFGLQPLTIQSKHDEAFDVEAVTKEFYKAYKAQFKELEKELINQTSDGTWAHDYSLQFLNRCMFIYFIQRKDWLGNDRDFLLNFWKSYQRSEQSQNSFVDNWLKVLFFEAFRDKPIAYHTHFPTEIRDTLSMAPYLNGGLFNESILDQEHKAIVSDWRFKQILDFLEQYNFTIAEDSPLDKEVAVDPEMIGKVYEGLVNVSEEVDEQGEAGIFYTPRTEIDLMCRLSLVDHLANHFGNERKELLNQLVFALEPDEKTDADKAVVTADLWPALNERLHDITLLDPACGSGSFLVGMLNILDDLQERGNHQLGVTEAPYERKKRIIGQSLYGVDVMEWACHVAELRLWLALIIDADFTREELHVRRDPLLPHFSFKIRCGDSLVQEVGGINLGHGRDSRLIPHHQFKPQIEQLKEEKLKFYNNDATGKLKSVEAIRNEEKRLFLEMLNARHQAIQEEIKSRRRKLEGQQERRIRLDGTIEVAPPHQMDLNASKYRQEIESLTTELAQTEAARKALSSAKEVPFVWDIAFVEIFEGEKEGFDIVIGNPPYVRQEAIAAPVVHGVQVTDDKKEYKAKLALSVYQAFPHFFGYKAGSLTVAHKINGKSDLYIYFYLHGLSLLNRNGSFCFITSNSWLDVGYGADLQEFLLKHSHVKLVLDNQVKRSFANADINSIMVLFSSPDDRREWALEKTARFVMFRVPFEHILSPIIFDEIEEAEECRATKEYRVFPVTQSKLLEDGCEIPEEEETGKAAGPLIKTARYIGNKWGGKYLRAPDIYWTILEKGKGKLVRLGDIAKVRFGIKTGANEFFYLNEESIRDWEIEQEFLKPVIVSPRECSSVEVKPEELHYRAFVCHKDKNALKGTSALLYIKWGEKQEFDNRPSCRSRQRWYEFPERDWARVLWPMIHNDRQNVFWNSRNVAVDHNLFEILEYNDDILWGSLAWTAQILFRELHGRANLGQGALKTEGIDIRTFYVLNTEEQSIVTALSEARSSLAVKKIGSIQEESQSRERQSLDNIIFDIIGLTQGERDAVYEAAISLVELRLKKAGSV